MHALIFENLSSWKFYFAETIKDRDDSPVILDQACTRPVLSMPWRPSSAPPTSYNNGTTNSSTTKFSKEKEKNIQLGYINRWANSYIEFIDKWIIFYRNYSLKHVTLNSPNSQIDWQRILKSIMICYSKSCQTSPWIAPNFF